MKIMSAIVRSASIVAGMSNGYEFITLPRPPSMGLARHCEYHVGVV